MYKDIDELIEKLKNDDSINKSSISNETNINKSPSSSSQNTSSKNNSQNIDNKSNTDQSKDEIKSENIVPVPSNSSNTETSSLNSTIPNNDKLSVKNLSTIIVEKPKEDKETKENGGSVTSNLSRRQTVTNVKVTEGSSSITSNKSKKNSYSSKDSKSKGSSYQNSSISNASNSLNNSTKTKSESNNPKPVNESKSTKTNANNNNHDDHPPLARHKRESSRANRKSETITITSRPSTKIGSSKDKEYIIHKSDRHRSSSAKSISRKTRHQVRIKTID